jgi:hypothetical protein
MQIEYQSRETGHPLQLCAGSYFSKIDGVCLVRQTRQTIDKTFRFGRHGHAALKSQRLPSHVSHEVLLMNGVKEPVSNTTLSS